MMVPWMVYQGWAAQRTADPSRRAVCPVALAAATVTVMIIGLYLLVIEDTSPDLYTMLSPVPLSTRGR